jgi:heptose-I-phosphate ethanolaminephosphotransferase
LIYSCFVIFLLMFSAPNSLYGTIVRDTSQSIQTNSAFIKASAQRQQRLQTLTCTDHRPGVYLLVIGESENRLHMSAYGYDRDTTPWLREAANRPDCLLFSHAYANFVCTMPALTYALTEKNQYNDLSLPESATLIEAARAAGFHTIMRSNQGKCGLYANAVTDIEKECDDAQWLHPQQFSNQGQERMDFRVEDGDVVSALKEISIPAEGKTLIVLHLMGSHDHYINRYPKDFHPFGNDTNLNQYDNSVAYNDEIMRQIYEYARTLPHFQCMVYLSDHSEAVDHGLMHSSDTYIPEMTYIPLYLFASQDFRNHHPETWNTLSRHRDSYFTNDLLYDLMCSLMDIRTTHYEAKNDITSPEYDDTPTRFRTEHGKRKIEPSSSSLDKNGEEADK